MKQCYVTYLNNVPYKKAIYLQEALVERRIRALSCGNSLSNLLLLLQHPPVYTVGRRGALLKENEDEVAFIKALRHLGADYVQVSLVLGVNG
jgi:lipoate-protein ligase B